MFMLPLKNLARKGLSVGGPGEILTFFGTNIIPDKIHRFLIVPL